MNRRITADRRLQNMVCADERRQMMRRNLEEWRRMKSDRRVNDIEVEEEPAKAFVFDPGVSLSTIVDSINAVGAGASDLVAILEALRESGALRAELIII